MKETHLGTAKLQNGEGFQNRRNKKEGKRRKEVTALLRGLVGMPATVGEPGLRVRSKCQSHA